MPSEHQGKYPAGCVVLASGADKWNHVTASVIRQAGLEEGQSALNVQIEINIDNQQAHKTQTTTYLTKLNTLLPLY